MGRRSGTHRHTRIFRRRPSCLTLGTHFDAGKPDAKDEIDRVSSRPDLMVLIYPVITMGEFTHGGSKANLLGENPTAGSRPPLFERASGHKGNAARVSHPRDHGPCRSGRKQPYVRVGVAKGGRSVRASPLRARAARFWPCTGKPDPRDMDTKVRGLARRSRFYKEIMKRINKNFAAAVFAALLVQLITSAVYTQRRTAKPAKKYKRPDDHRG